jgi:phenol 2-monooxygenase
MLLREGEGTGYLYDTTTGAASFHVLVFASSFSATVRSRLTCSFAAVARPDGSHQRFGGSKHFDVLLVVRLPPMEMEEALSGLKILRQHATVIYDDSHSGRGCAHHIEGESHFSLLCTQIFG